MTFCSSCGAQMEDTSAFCLQCGAQRVASTQPPLYPQPVYYVKPRIPGRGFGITSMVLGIIGLAYGLYLLIVSVVIEEVVSISTPTYLYGTDASAFTSAFNTGMIIGLVISYLLYSSLSIMAVCFAIPARKRGYDNNISKSGLVMGAIGIALYVLCIFITLATLA